MLKITNLLSLAAVFSLLFIGGQSALADFIPPSEERTQASNVANQERTQASNAANQELAQTSNAAGTFACAGLALGAAVVSAGVWAVLRLKK